MLILPPPPIHHYASARRILICLRYGIGDVLMEWPLLEALRRAAPSARITALGARPATQLLDRCDLVDEVLSTQSLGVEHWGSEGDAEIARRIARMLHEHGPFDLVLDALQAPCAVRQLLWRAGIQTVEIDQDVQADALREEQGVLEASAQAAEVGWNLAVRRPLRARLSVPRQHQAAAQGWLLKRNLASSRLAAVSPVASLSLKRWPIDRLAAAADRLAAAMDRVLILPGPQEHLGTKLLEMMRRRDQAIIVPAMHLLDTAAILERCEALVGNDTGLMHLAAAVGTPVVGVFGPTAPQLYRPRHSHAMAVSGEPIDCPHRHTHDGYPPGCWFEDTCMLGERSCIDRVTVDDVHDAVAELVDLTADGKPVPAIAS